MGYSGDGSKKKKMAMLGVSSILLVAAVVGAVTYGISSKNNAETGAPAGGASASPSSSTKAVQSICKHVDYKETCENSLAKAGNTSDPKELVKVAFQDAAKDPRTSQALETCKEVLDTAIDDFKRSFARVEEFDMSKVDEYLADLKTWLSGAITYQETCIDAFENTTGTTGEKMKQLLTTASQLSSNGLAMVSQFSEIIGTLNIPGLNRKLMSTEALDEQSYPDFVNAKQRKLLGADPSTLKPNAVIALDGSGTHKTFKDVINTIPKNNSVPFVILVKAGVYHETVMIPRKINNVYIFGEGPEKTKITGNKNYVDGIGTFHTATVGDEGIELVVDSKDLQQQSKALDKLTDHVEDRQLDSTRVQEAMASIAASREADLQAKKLREKELAAVKINAVDVDIIANELELDKKLAERVLREHKGDAVAAIRSLID
ncbi:OLC1v1020596C1 [Oldenlandia corymbosa var. corymbosa]|uniref:OLC1v1020596C1 n=1 Tax=Oldenlandia corymbosa var. corymbosa TaxID=529605 RepID=A0AAV1EGW6_OLDCO|nr:OLC1v1020596C1 [Oldenlandia corymbosa var. corymbosa]